MMKVLLKNMAQYVRFCHAVHVFIRNVVLLRIPLCGVLIKNTAKYAKLFGVIHDIIRNVELLHIEKVLKRGENHESCRFRISPHNSGSADLCRVLNHSVMVFFTQ